MYRSKRYTVRPLETLYKEIDLLSSAYPGARRVFLADGDALSLPTEHLLALLEHLHGAFAKLGRVSLYASAQNLLQKSEPELRQLREHGLGLIYYGIETGSDLLLEKINKGVSSEQIVASLNKATRAGLKISATVILGIGGEVYSCEHIEATAAVVNATSVNYLSTLQLGLDEACEEDFYRRFEGFVMPDDARLLEEQKRFLELLAPRSPVIFRSNHASNALHLAGTLPRDSRRLIAEVEAALAAGERVFVPKWFRGF
jgi:hypothetical protein